MHPDSAAATAGLIQWALLIGELTVITGLLAALTSRRFAVPSVLLLLTLAVVLIWPHATESFGEWVIDETGRRVCADDFFGCAPIFPVLLVNVGIPVALLAAPMTLVGWWLRRRARARGQVPKPG